MAKAYFKSLACKPAVAEWGGAKIPDQFHICCLFLNNSKKSVMKALELDGKLLLSLLEWIGKTLSLRVIVNM